VVWRASQFRGDFKTYSVRDIADLEFFDVITKSDIFRRMATVEIVEEFKSASRLRAPASTRQ
jgi:hypothetical protein